MATYMQNVIWVSSSLSTRNLQRSLGARISKQIQHRNMCSSGPDEPSPEIDKPGFTDPQVQAILRRITCLDLEKVFRPSREWIYRSSYRLLSENKLKELQAAAEDRARKRLKMPPVVEERKPITKVLSKNPELRGLDSSKFVFTDITYGLRDRNRFIVVRDTDGTLRSANWDERDRITQVYMPRENRKMQMPELFQDQNLPTVFSADRHEMVLDAACTQFEPDAADFIRVHHRVYDDLDKTAKYDHLRSTRHFGGMAFYLVRQRRIDGLLIDMIQRNLISDAEDLVVLYHLMHPKCQSAVETKNKELKGLDVIKAYIKSDASQAGKLELVLQSYENEQAGTADASSDQASGTQQ